MLGRSFILIAVPLRQHAAMPGDQAAGGHFELDAD